MSSIAEAVWIWFISTATKFPPGDSGDILLYTIPTGYKGIISDVAFGGAFCGESKFYIASGDNIFWGYHEAYQTINHSFCLPPVAEPGEKIYYRLWNLDIIAEHWRAVLTMWQVPGSEPEKPKRDEPLERFRLGDFSSATQFILPNNETIFLFRKRNEDKENYLRFENYGLKDQKKIASLHLKPEEAQKIISIIHTKPEKVNRILRKFEKKYKGL
jgi:hypothetical protein